MMAFIALQKAMNAVRGAVNGTWEKPKKRLLPRSAKQG
jgi:hypothetical protein